MKITLAETAEKLKNANSFIITAHVSPDGDAIGSCLAMWHVLTGLGKKARVIIDDKYDKNFNILPGHEHIEFPADDETYTADYMVLLDASTDRCGRVLEKCKSMPVLNIDHHISNDEKADFLCLDAKASACAEVLYSLVKEMGIKLNLNIATNLYTGIATDSGYFRYSNTTPFTMHAAAELLATGIRPEKISQTLEVRTYEHVKGLARAMQTIEMFEDGKVAGVFMTYDMLEGLESTEGFIDSIRIIEGVDVAIFLKEVEPNKCRVSMRSKESNVSEIAQSMGGGGHIRAAGCTLSMSFEEAKKTAMKAIHEGLA